VLLRYGATSKERTLVVPIEGGELFLPAKAAAGSKHGADNADENAAVNIGLRALAHPDRLDIFPRIRTVKKADETVSVRNKRGYFASLPEDDTGRELRVDRSALPLVDNGFSILSLLTLFSPTCPPAAAAKRPAAAPQSPRFRGA
jgi:hypothetical protein